MTEYRQNAMAAYFGLDGKSAIVTGAGNGIGRATAQMLAAFGARVTVCDIEAESATRVVEEIVAAGGQALAMPCDVTELGDIQAAVGQAAGTFGGVDILVNNAGGGGGGIPFDKITYPEWDRLIRLNLTSAWMFTNEVLPYMVKKQAGKIVMVSSGAAFGYDFSDPHYAATKAGMLGLAKELSRELAPHRINVNALGTGLTDTRMSHAPGRDWAEATKDLPWHRVGTPEDQAAAIVYLCSAAADYVTGQVLCPNGGAWM